VKLKDWRLEPPRRPGIIGVCCGCGDTILVNEEYHIFENGRRIHNHPDCKVYYVDRLLGHGR
jgi:pyruvate/2-oxoacid:ferredoxin oxidoreductase beta subunit